MKQLIHGHSQDAKEKRQLLMSIRMVNMQNYILMGNSYKERRERSLSGGKAYSHRTDGPSVPEAGLHQRRDQQGDEHKASYGEKPYL